LTSNEARIEPSTELEHRDGEIVVLSREAEHLARMDQSYGCLGASDDYGDTTLASLLNAVPRAGAGVRC
jgi:hypothetical protein